MTQSKTLKVILFLLVLILAGVSLSIYMIGEKGVSKDVTVSPLRTGQRPRNLPDDLPIPPGAALSKNFEAKTPDGTQQGTIEYSSDKGRQLLVREYQRYFTKKGILSKQELVDGGRTYLTASSEGKFYSVDFLDLGDKTLITVTGINIEAK